MLYNFGLCLVTKIPTRIMPSSCEQGKQVCRAMRRGEVIQSIVELQDLCLPGLDPLSLRGACDDADELLSLVGKGVVQGLLALAIIAPLGSHMALAGLVGLARPDERGQVLSNTGPCWSTEDYLLKSGIVELGEGTEALLYWHGFSWWLQGDP